MVWLWCRGVCIYCKNRHNLVFQQKTMAIFRNCVLVLLREIYNDLYQANYKINMYWMYNSSLVMWFFPRYMSPHALGGGLTYPPLLWVRHNMHPLLHCTVLYCTGLYWAYAWLKHRAWKLIWCIYHCSTHGIILLVGTHILMGSQLFDLLTWFFEWPCHFLGIVIKLNDPQPNSVYYSVLKAINFISCGQLS